VLLVRALYFVDAKEVIRHHTFGEGDYEHSEIAIQRLLAEGGVVGADRELLSIEGVEAVAEWGNVKSPP
jgi:hypothetical protein